MENTKRILVPAIFSYALPRVKECLIGRGLEPICLNDITDDEINAGYAHIDNDVCASTVAIIGQYVSYFQEHGSDDAPAVLVPELCRDCRAQSLPLVIETAFSRAGLDNIELVELSNDEIVELFEGLTAPASSETSEDTAPSDTPVVGLCGTVPALTTDLFNRVVTGTIRQAECNVAIPPLSLVVGKRDAITPAVEYFHEQGVGHVVCLLPFGCLSGHVFARGQLRKLAKKYPDVALTMLDYDPSASDINLVNRTELVVQSAKEDMRAQK